MNNRASQSIRVGTTTGVFVAIILECNDVASLVNPGYKNNEQQAYPTIDTTMDIDEKNVRLCKACARFPMARIVVSTKNSLVNDFGITKKKYLHAPEAPKTPIKAILKSIFIA
jgi:hypothetical protein